MSLNFDAEKIVNFAWIHSGDTGREIVVQCNYCYDVFYRGIDYKLPESNWLSELGSHIEDNHRDIYDELQLP